MDANELKRLMDENFDQLTQIIADSQNGPPEAALVAEVMGPMLLEFQSLKEQIFNISELPDDTSQPSSDEHLK